MMGCYDYGRFGGWRLREICGRRLVLMEDDIVDRHRGEREKGWLCHWPGRYFRG